MKGKLSESFRGTYSYIIGDSETPNRLLLVRHGEVTTVGQLYGQLDVPLSERGLEQSRGLVDRLREYKIDAVICSDLQRVRYPAELVAGDRGLEVDVRLELRERMFGEWQGLTWDEIAQDSPEAFQQYMDDFLTAKIPGDGESYFQVRDRVMPVIQESMNGGEGRTVLMIGHAGVIRVILAEALEMSLRNIFRVTLDYVGLSIVEYHPNGRQTVRLING